MIAIVTIINTVSTKIINHRLIRATERVSEIVIALGTRISMLEVGATTPLDMWWFFSFVIQCSWGVAQVICLVSFEYKCLWLACNRNLEQTAVSHSNRFAFNKKIQRKGKLTIKYLVKLKPDLKDVFILTDENNDAFHVKYFNYLTFQLLNPSTY